MLNFGLNGMDSGIIKISVIIKCVEVNLMELVEIRQELDKLQNRIEDFRGSL